MAIALSPRLGPAARPYRLPWHVILIGEMDARTRRCFAAAGALGLVVLGLLIVAPAPVEETPSLEAMPDRLARLILEEPRPEPAAPAARAQAALPAVPEPAPAPAAKAAEPPKPAAQPAPERAPRRVERVAQAPRVAPDQGLAGRREAEAATKALASTSKALDATLAKLATALPASEAPSAPAPGAGRSRLRRGRGQESLGRVESGVAAAAPAGEGPVLLAAGLSVDIGEWSAGGGAAGGTGNGAGGARGTGAAGGPATASAGAGGGEIRSNASLLAVLQRYAPGIRYCYDNALKRDASLGGKLVLRLTVEADGSVSEAAVLEDGLKSREVLDCVLAQVKAWDFGRVPAGQVSFRAPFVFTPGQ